MNKQSILQSCRQKAYDLLEHLKLLKSGVEQGSLEEELLNHHLEKVEHVLEYIQWEEQHPAY